MSENEATSASPAPTEAGPTDDPGKSKGGSGPLMGVLFFLLALGGGFVIGRIVQDKAGDARVLDDNTRYGVELRGDEPQIGPDNALVTIIEFADYQCPYCEQARGPVEEALADAGDDVRLIYKHFPLPGHRLATPAAKAAWAAHQQGKFWEMHKELFTAKGSVKDIGSRAAAMGMDHAKFVSDFQSQAASEAVDNDLLSGARIGVTGTPVFFVNGHRYVGFRDTSQWKEVIAFETENAEKLIDSGVPRDGVFAKLMEDAVTQRRGGGAAKRAAAADPRPGGLDPDKTHRVEVDGRPAMGPEDALVTVAVFSDFQCPYCSRYAPTLHQLVKAHDDVRVVFMQLPIPSHRRARDAAKAALAAERQGKFWEMHDLLFERRSELMDANFLEYAATLELDAERFKADLEDDALEQNILADVAVSNALGIRSTPSTFVNGRYLRGAVSFADLESAVSEQRVVAQARVDAGIAPADVYAALMADAE